MAVVKFKNDWATEIQMDFQSHPCTLYWLFTNLAAQWLKHDILTNVTVWILYSHWTCTFYCQCFRNVPRCRHQMEAISALLALCAGNSPITGEFPSQRPVTPSFDVFFNLCLNKRLSKQSWRWWFETPSFSLWRHCNGNSDCLWSGYTPV